ncbi:MAG TPA: lipid II flippase MurJ [Paludibacteraceae bacterium]|jgi:peptidoglycan biosynthesis protein MviN/MurJ (putative lipid II flippase)|nr:lipid II flippase MurJ [Paludibacteraceae bacterium]HOU67268.1 lipid II flippase MurJ [Paludibacteraceae bacterium]HPH63075.1 lipid II flippase MurJ [Paludibacteraceae bacterium]HQF49399.1 lipid II flippase MurJ [Paludibacteraceae bacterium]
MNFLSSPRRISFALSILRFAKMFLGVVVLFLSVKYFGTSYERDSWVIAIAFWGMVVQTIYTPLNDTFRTRFIFLKSKLGEVDAIKTVNSLLSFFWITFLFIGIFLFIARSGISELISPGFKIEEQNFLITMILFLIPYFIFQQLTNVLIALLNTYDSYFYPELISLTASIINILAIVVLSSSIGIYSLVLATTINGLIMVATLSVLLKKKMPKFSLITFHGISKAKLFISFSLPIYLATFSSQAYQMVEKALCTNFGTGSVSLFDYARQIMNLPWIVFSSIIPIVLTPILSKCFINDDEKTFSKELRQFTRMLMFFSIIISVIMIVNCEQLSYIFFKKADFEFMKILTFLGITINFIILGLICGQSLIAENRIKQYVLGVVSGNLISILLCFTLANLFPLFSISIFYLIGQILTTILLVNSLQVFDKKSFILDIVYLTFIFVGVICIIYTIEHLFLAQILPTDNIFYSITDIIICGLLSILLILSAIFLFNMEEKNSIINLKQKVLEYIHH